MLMDDYAWELTSRINEIRMNQRESILQAAGFVRDTVKADGLVYVFGCGHSHMLGEEGFYRAGGLACVCPMLFEPLMLQEGAVRSSTLEKQDGLYAQVLSRYGLTGADMLICVSTSGVNSVPVELASAVTAMGIPTVGISSWEYLNQEAHNPLHAHLKDVCRVSIDNRAPYGDACLQPEGLEMKAIPASTVLSVYAMNSIFAEAIALMHREGIEAPLYVSGNIPGGREKNRRLIEKYSPRIRHL